MNATYRFAWKEGDTVFYLDDSDCKYAAKNGNLAWCINNPGLVKHHCRFAKKNGSIGAWEQFAIFSNPLQGHQTLKEWLHSKTMLQLDLYGIGKYYQPISLEQFAKNLASASGIPPKTKLKELTQAEFEVLLTAIEKLCGFLRTGNEEFFLLPKIAARIESPDKEDLYLIGKDQALTKKEAINWIISHRLDGVIVHHSNGDIHLRSRPRYHMQTLKLTWEQHCATTGEIETLARTLGEKIPGQCIWGFVNGISNTREKAIESCRLISSTAGNEQIFFLKNDEDMKGINDFITAIILKLGIDTPIVKRAVQFLRFLLESSERQENNPPVIVFAHSQGAAIVEHAIGFLSDQEKQKIRIFTFGGWSFIPPGVTHTESHNYASVGDLIPRVGSFNLQYLALRRCEGLKEGLTQEEIIRRLAFGDAVHDLDCLDPHILERYTSDLCKHYRNEFEKISNVTVLDSGSMWEHSFNNECYQNIIREKIKKYKKIHTRIALVDSQKFPVESFV